MMIKAVVFACFLAVAASIPLPNDNEAQPAYVIMYDGPDGRHTQMGEPGKAVSGYFTSRSLNGEMEYKTMYTADENGFRATGDHLPQALVPAVEARTADSAAAAYIFKYDAEGSQHYQMGEPGVAVQGSYMYYDPEGKARRVDYIADDKGYRIKTEEPEVKISETNPPAAAAAPIVEPVEPVPEVKVESAPAVVEPQPVQAESASSPEIAAAPVVAVEPAAPLPVKLETPDVVDAVPAVAATEAVAEPKSGDAAVPYFSLPAIVPHPGVSYFRSSIPYVQPTFRFAPAFGYAHGYNYGYPFTSGNFVYAL